MSWRLQLVKGKPTHVAYLETEVGGEGNGQPLTWEQLEQLHNQVADVWRLAHAERRKAQAKEDLL